MAITLTANGGIIYDSIGLTAFPRQAIGADQSVYRNRISNGNMTLSQRTYNDTTTHASGTTDNTVKHFVADRFRVFSYYGSASNVISYQRVYAGGNTASYTPEGHGAYARITSLVNTAPGTSDYCGIMTAIEGYDFYDFFFNGTQAVPGILSFWARASITGKYCVSFRDSTNSRTYATHYDLVANTWTKVYIPLIPCNEGTWYADKQFGLRIFWTLASGSTFKVGSGSESTWVTGNYLSNQYQTDLINQTAGQTFDLTGVCLERAPAAALCAYVIRNDYVPTNGTTGLSLLQSGDFDDTFFTVNLPFAIKMFGKSSSTLYVSTNGYLGIDPNGAWGGIPSVLTPNTPSVEHIGFFKADKRMLTLYGGSKTLTQQDNRSLTVYTLRWEGYNYGGSSTVKTIVEFNFYADTETYEGFNFIDVKYATNDNGTQYLEVNPGYTNAGSSYPYARSIVTTGGYRIFTKAFVPVMGTSPSVQPGAWWNQSTTPYTYAYTATALSDNTQYKLGASSSSSVMDSGIDRMRCMRYYEKTGDESTVVPPSGDKGGAGFGSSNMGIYFRFKTYCASTSYIPIRYHQKRDVPTITLFSLGGSRGYVTLDNGQQAVVGYVFNGSEQGSMTRVDYSVGINHYGYYSFVTIDSDI